MLKKRVIPFLTFNGFGLVKTKQFANPRMVGNPMQAARVYNSRNVDELVFIDIFASAQKRKVNPAVVKQVINECFMPVTIGGGISTEKDIHAMLDLGADKVVIKSAALSDPDFITQAAKIFGAQCLVIAADVVRSGDAYVISDKTGAPPRDAAAFIASLEALGAGEVCITDTSADGMMGGFDEKLFATLSSKTNLPVIACGGAGKPEDFPVLLDNPNITGLGAGSIFHYTQYTPFDIKYAVNNAGFPVRLFDEHLKEGVNI